MRCSKQVCSLSLSLSLSLSFSAILTHDCYNALFKTALTPPPAPPHNGSLDEHDDYVKLIGASPMHIHSAAEFSQFSASHAGSGEATVLADPKFRGVPSAAGGEVDMEKLTRGGLEAGSPLAGAGAAVQWAADFNGKPIPPHSASIGPFQ